MSNHPAEVPCSFCSGPSPRAILPQSLPFFSVDNEDRSGYNIGAGRYFSNRRERREYLHTSDFREMYPEEAAPRIAAYKEARARREDEIGAKLPPPAGGFFGATG